MKRGHSHVYDARPSWRTTTRVATPPNHQQIFLLCLDYVLSSACVTISYRYCQLLRWSLWRLADLLVWNW